MTLDLVDRVIGVGAKPESADRHRMARPCLELAAMTCAVHDKKPSRGETDAAPPCKGQAAMCFLDEIIEIAVPAIVEVREEHQPTSIVDEGPMGEVNRAHAAEIAVRRHHPQYEAQSEVPGPKQRHAQ